MESFELENVAVVEPSWLERLFAWIRLMTNTERNFFFATCALSVTSLILVLAVILIPIYGGDDYCVSKECVRTAAQIIASMNSSADPCSDFYEFACGGWQSIGGEEEDNWNRRSLKHTTRQTADLLSKSDVDDEHGAVSKARNLYRSCMATDVLDKLGLEPLLGILERAGLPRGIPNKDTAVGFDLSRTLARVHRTLGQAVLIDVFRETNETFTVWVPPLDLDDTPNLAVLEAIDDWVNGKRTPDLLSNSTIEEDWQSYAQNMTLLLKGMEAIRAGRFSEINGFDGTEDLLPPKMKRMRLPASNITSILYNGTVPSSISNTLYYEVYMETLLEGKPEVNWTLNTGTLRLADPEFHLYVISVLQDYSPLDIQMLVWSEVVKHFGIHTTTDLRQRMKNRVFAMKSQAPRSEACAELVIILMPVVVDHLIAQVEPLKDVTENVKAMTKEIQESQRELVENAEWMDSFGLQNIMKHLDKVSVARVGYIDWVASGEGLDEFFADITIHPEQLLRTIADIQVWQVETNMFVSPKVGRLRMDHVLAGAYYYRSMNTITVRPLIMRFPFYPLGLQALNYGAMGLVLGHEFGHALDAEAFFERDYFLSKQQAVEKVDSFVNCTKERILELSEKLNSAANPDQSINEDVSDISGVKSALHTFNRIRRGPELYLPGLEKFSHDQLFFLAFANVWCTNGKPPGPDAEDGPHNANRFRILSSASNTPEFAEIWNCPRDSPMNPERKCTLW